MKFLDLNGLNTLKSYIKNTYAKKPKVITSSQLDTCGYESAAVLARAAKNSETGLVFYVSDMYSTLYVFGENPVHGCVQVLVGNCVMDTRDSSISTSHKDGISATYVRTYLHNPVTIYNKDAGFDSTTQEWSAWIIRETNVATKTGVAANNINVIKQYFGDLLSVDVGTNADKNKLTLSSMYTGGLLKAPGASTDEEIPEASQTCNGLMSVADKIKLDGLSDGGGTVTDPTSVAKIVRFDSVVTEDVTITAGSTSSDNCILVYLKAKNIFAIKDQDNNTYYNNGGIILNDNPGIWVSESNFSGLVLNFVEGYKAIPNAIYVDKDYKMYIGGVIQNLNDGGKFCQALDVINVTNIPTNEINVMETE